ncbi:hypothetical protein [Streptomyces sp. NPDC059515]|uniref:hypothetical protein n=1 Tax=Streptomyces sp. NPDC059515 TaxID=3346854 RepID=UPI003679367B
MAVHRGVAGIAGVGFLLMAVAGCGSDSTGGEPAADKGTPRQESAKADPVALTTEARDVVLTDDDDNEHRLRITPKSLLRGSESDLSGVRLGDDLKGGRPYYLTVSVTNTGEADLTSPDLAGHLSVAGVDGWPGKRLTVFGGGRSALSDHCPKGNPETLAAGATAEVCTPVMLAKGLEPGAVAYQDDSGTALWEAGDGKGHSDGVAELGEPKEADVEDSDGEKVRVEAVAKSVRKGSLDHLSRYTLKTGDRKLVPYYVTIEYRNKGEHDLYPGMQDDVLLQTVAGQQIRKLTLIDIGGPGVKQCPSRLPDGMVGPGAKVTQCSIHLVPEGDSPAAAFWMTDGAEAGHLAWRASGNKGGDKG